MKINSHTNIPLYELGWDRINDVLEAMDRPMVVRIITKRGNVYDGITDCDERLRTSGISIECAFSWSEANGPEFKQGIGVGYRSIESVKVANINTSKEYLKAVKKIADAQGFHPRYATTIINKINEYIETL